MVQTRGKGIAFPVLLLLFSLLFFSKPLTQPDRIFSPAFDLITQYAFFKEFITKSFSLYHELPLWNPLIFSGTPFIADPLGPTYFYFPNFLVLFLPLGFAFSLLFLLHTLAACLFTYLFGRKIGLSREASFISGIIFAFSAPLMNRLGVGQLNNFVVISLVPLVFLATEALILNPRMTTTLLFALALFLQFSGSNPQLFAYSSFALFLYFALSLVFLYKKERDISILKKRAITAVCGLAIFIPLSLGGLLPQLEFVKMTTRTEASLSYASSLSLPIRHLITAIFPTIYGSPVSGDYFGAPNYWELGLYCGILPLILAGLGIIFTRGRHKTIFIVLGSFALLFSLGRSTPLFALCYYLIPLFRGFRIPATYLFLYGFALAILAGLGTDWLLSEERKEKETKLRLTIIILVGLSLIIGALIILLPSPAMSFIKKIGTTFYQEKGAFISAKVPLFYHLLRKNLLSFLFFFVGGGIAIFYLLKGKLKRESFFLLITAIIIVDLFILHLPFTKTESLNKVFAPIPTIEFLKSDKSQFRILDLVRTRQHLTGHYSIEKITGAHPLVLRRYVEFTNLIAGLRDTSPGEMLPIQRVRLSDIKNLNLLSLLNVKYIIAKEESSNPAFSEVFREKTLDKKGRALTIHIYENKEVLPRAFIVHQAEVIAEEGKILTRLTEIDPRKTVILEKRIGTLSNKKGETRTKIISSSPNRMIITAELASPGYLVLSEIYYPGWKAYEIGEGKELPILRADYILRAIYLTPGKHRIMFVFKPKSYLLGKGISLSALILLVFLLLLTRYYRHRSPRSTSLA